MQATQAELRVGIVLYQNKAEEIEQCLAGLEGSSSNPRTPRYRVAFLDNSPTAALRPTIEAWGHSYQHAQRNCGFGGGHNQLMAEAFAAPEVEAYLCVNPDAVLHPDCLAELWAELRRRPKEGLIEAVQFPDEHPKQYCPDTHQTDWCSGCVLLIPRAIHQSVGGFDERFFMYCEDVDLSWRTRAAGFETRIAPRALAFHYFNDRTTSSRGHVLLLQSGALLGLKYGDEQFARGCLDELRKLDADLSPQALAHKPAGASERRVANFKRQFHFAEVRW